MSNIIFQSDNASKQAKNLLFASLYMEIDDILQAAQTLINRPELGGKIQQTLFQMMAEEMPKLKGEMTPEELKKAAIQRVDEWSKSIGTPSMDQYATLNKYWGVPVGEVIREKITPKVVYDLLDCFLVGQQDYKRKLSTSFFLHLMKKDEHKGMASLPKNTLMVQGPSGSGKTYGVQTLGHLFGVKVIFIHGNTLVREGIVGMKFSDYYTEAWLASKAKSNEEKIKELSLSVVVIDEFDKVREEVMNELLSLIDDDGEIIFPKDYTHNNDVVRISTKRMMFVFTGVFEGIDKIKNHEGFGFRNGITSSPKAIDSSSLIKYGIKPEIVGRIQNYTSVDRLSVNDYFNLLNSKLESPLNDYLNYFHQNDIEVDLTEDAKMALAQVAFDKELGVRGLKNLLNTIFSEEMFNLANGHLVIDQNYIIQHSK